jgi:single-strand DNA-binding protein
MSAFAQISGRLGQAPELRHTHGGTAVVNLSVANNRTVKSGEGRKSVADWFKVTVYGRDAETIATHAKKGSALTFNGRLQTESYETREGQRRTDTILVADAFEFLPARRREGEGGAKAEAEVSPAAGAESEPDFDDEDFDF